MRAGFVVFKGKRKNNNSNSVDCKGLKRLIAVTAGVVAVILTAVFSQAFFSGWLDLCRSGFFFHWFIPIFPNFVTAHFRDLPFFFSAFLAIS